MTQNLAGDLHAARELIANAGDVAKAMYACDRLGRTTTPESSDAVRWCALGALAKAVPTVDRRREAARALHRAASALYEIDDVIVVNDRMGFTSVLAVYGVALANLRPPHATDVASEKEK